MMRNLLLVPTVLMGALLASCQSNSRVLRPAPPDLPLTTSIVFQADLEGCKRSSLFLYRETAPTVFDPVDRIDLVNRAVRDGDGDVYEARGGSGIVHTRGMLPGRYHIRNISCGNRRPRDEFAIGYFDVIEGRSAYAGHLVVGKRDGRVLLEVENRAEEAYEALQESEPDAVAGFGQRLLVSNIPTLPR